MVPIIPIVAWPVLLGTAVTFACFAMALEGAPEDADRCPWMPFEVPYILRGIQNIFALCAICPWLPWIVKAMVQSWN